MHEGFCGMAAVTDTQMHLAHTSNKFQRLCWQQGLWRSCGECPKGLVDHKTKKTVKASIAAEAPGTTAFMKALLRCCCDRHTDALGTYH